MAHFAKLNENNDVVEVIVINNDVLDSENEEASGIAFLTEWSGGHSKWKQTSYSGSIRKHYAGVGYKYDEYFDVFIPSQPFPSWKLDYTTYTWLAPVLKPDDGENYYWKWSEINKEWIKVEVN